MAGTDKRQVATDALETLGTIIGPEQERDAIHLAVEPVRAGHTLSAGDHVAVKNGVATLATSEDALGIVDPFLLRPVEKGERFWFVMYPRQVHSLRHVWTHPAFDDEPEVAKPARIPEHSPGEPTLGASPEKPEKELQRAHDVVDSLRWIEKFAASINQTTYRLMDAALHYVEYSEYAMDNTEVYKDVSSSKWVEFWAHYTVVTGTSAERAFDDFGPVAPFTCSC